MPNKQAGLKSRGQARRVGVNLVFQASGTSKHIFRQFNLVLSFSTRLSRPLHGGVKEDPVKSGETYWSDLPRKTTRSLKKSRFITCPAHGRPNPAMTRVHCVQIIS